MKVQNPASQLPPQPSPVAQRPPAPQRRLGPADLADLAPASAPPAPARTAPQAAAADTRPLRPGSLLDIRV